MSTRGIYTFKDGDTEVHVYKHWDNYPSAALLFIRNALPFAWELPRFEADDFAAAFVAANKAKGGGDIRLINGEVTDMGQEYHYIVTIEKHNSSTYLCVEFDEHNQHESGRLSLMIEKHCNRDE